MTAAQQAGKKKDKKGTIPLAKLPRILVSRRWWWATILVIAGVLVMGRLGIWQLDRQAQRRAANAAYLTQISVEPLNLNDDAFLGKPETLVDRQAEVSGQYDFSNEVLLVQQNYLGKPGAHLITPLLLKDSQQSVLVNRGWIPASAVESADLSPFHQPGIQKVSGVIQLSQTLDRGRETEIDEPQQQWYRVDIGAIQEQMPYQLLPFYLLESPPAEYQAQLPYRLEREIDLSDGPHLGYAIQWFLFSTILALGYLRFVSTHSPAYETPPEPE